MKTIRSQTLLASFVVAILLLLNVSPATAGGLSETAEKQANFVAASKSLSRNG